MIDKHTKAVLTVIAVCLCLITAQNFNFIQSAEASGHGVQKVQICNWNGERCAFVGNNQLHVRDQLNVRPLGS